MPTKLEELAAVLRGTMPPEPGLAAPVDPSLRLYCDTLAAALLGALPALVTPPGVPGALTASYPTPWVVTPGPHLVACSTGAALPAGPDAVKGQLHVKNDGTLHIWNGTAWKHLTVT
jgi:hypothetical protein